MQATHQDLGTRYFLLGDTPLLFTENETNHARVFGTAGTQGYFKDGINDFVVNWKKDAINPRMAGTKMAAHYQMSVPAGGSHVIRLRLTDQAPGRKDRRGTDQLGDRFDDIVVNRQREADEFYENITPDSLDEDLQRVMRQALAGMIWTKRYYYFDVEQWLTEHRHDRNQRPSETPQRDGDWVHMLTDDVISMPDKWEYPWFAAWDLAFHSVPLALVDVDFAKYQLELLMRESYQHPNGQLPAYEWNFGDVNPPVHAWAILYVYEP